MAHHPAIQPGGTALVTGGASGIGHAAAGLLASAGMNIVLVDTDRDRLGPAAEAMRAAGAADVATRPTDMSDRGAVETMAAEVTDAFGGVDVLMLNAGIQPGSAMFGPFDRWRATIDVNFYGILHGIQAFVPAMVARNTPGAVIATGSKQGITTPPGDPAYNVSKSAVKTMTEALAHELRNSENPAVTAHLLIPGFVFTGLTARGRSDKPDGAWTSAQTAQFMMERLAEGDFYILCPDNDVDRALDEKRMAWAMGDIIENRPPLSRWHPDHADAFSRFVAGES
ncbi:MAG: SDR family NAD(P)-dependent oxidoreductase [Pseudomonadota bacterium]